MSNTYDFLKECGIFYVLTINGDYPAGRPFGVVMEVGEDLYISTNDLNQASSCVQTVTFKSSPKSQTQWSGYVSRDQQRNAAINR